MVLLNVLAEIDTRLQSHVRTYYTLKMSKEEILMDFKIDIMNNIPKFLQELYKEEQLTFIQGEADPQLKWIRQQRGGEKKKSGKSWRDKKYLLVIQDPDSRLHVACTTSVRCHKLCTLAMTLVIENAPSSPTMIG